MSAESAPYGRLERILARLDFAWRVSGSHVGYIADHDIWSARSRPGGPHGLWLTGHLAFYEASALSLYTGNDSNSLDQWKGVFGNGSPSLDDLSNYPDPADVQAQLVRGRRAIREAIAGFSEEDLDREVLKERLAIRDMQSQIEFLVWHDSHHAAQLGGIVNTHKDAAAS